MKVRSKLALQFLSPPVEFVVNIGNFADDVKVAKYKQKNYNVTLFW